MKLNIQLFAASKTINKTIYDSYGNDYQLKITVNESIPTDYIETNKTLLSGKVTLTNEGLGSANDTSKTMSAEIEFYAENSSGAVLASDSGKCAFNFEGSSIKTATPLTYSNLAIEHKENGTRTVYIKITFKVTSTSLKQTRTYNDTLELTTIPRASDIDSITDVITSNAPTIKWTPKSSSFKYKVKYTNSTGTQTTGLSNLISPASTEQYSYNSLSVPHTFFTNIQATTQTAAVYLYTYQNDGTTQIGLPYATNFNVELDSSIKPSLSISNLAEADSDMISKNWGIYVQNKSKLSFRVNPSFPNPVPASATITANTNDDSFSANTMQNTTFTTTALKTAGTNTISASITDSRDRPANAPESTYTVVAYGDPTITYSDVYRCNSSGTADDEGKYIHYTFKGEIYSINGNNNHTFVLKYRAKGSSGSYTQILSSNGTLDNGKYSLNATATYGTGNTFDTNTDYDFVFEAIDSFRTSSNPVTVTKNIGTGFDLLNFNESGKSMAIGTVSTRGSNEKVLDIELDSYLKKLYLYNVNTEQYDEIFPNIGSGTVTSVGVTAGGGISVSGSPITSSGSITVTNTGVRNLAIGTTNGTVSANINGTNQDIAVKGLGSAAYTDSTSYVPSNRGVEVIIGTQTSATANWLGTSTQSALYDGMRILYYLPRKGGLYPTLNLTLSGGNTTGAINVYRYKGDDSFRFQEIYGEKIYVPLTYNSTESAWFMDTEQNITYASALCNTAASTATKTAECINYSLLANSYVQIIMKNANSSQNALTLNINGAGAKPIYINGTASSSSNYTLPAGSYLIYYDGTNYYFRTDGKITGSITGNAATATSSAKLQLTNLPSNLSPNSFYLPFASGVGNSFDFYGTDSLKTYQLYGTSSVEGKSTLYLGNSTAIGTTGNKTGSIVLYNGKGKTTTLKTSSSLASTTLTLPTGSGTIATTGIDVSNFNNDAGYTANTGTVTGVTAGAGLNTTSNDTATDGGTISTSGTLYLTKSGVTAGTYQGITVDKYGRVTAAQDKGYTTNTGTITGIKMNGSSKGTSGVVDLGTVITSHQSIKTINNTAMTGTGNVSVQPTLVSGTNIKTINNESLLGSGNITVGGGTTASPNILRARPSSNVTISAKGNTKLTLATNVFQNGSNLSISSGGIKIGSGITKVKVYGTVYYSAGTNAGDSLRCVIYKNSDIVAENFGRAGTSGTYESRSIIPTPITVAQNDIIYLYYNNATAARGTISSDAAQTYLVVEQIL